MKTLVCLLQLLFSEEGELERYAVHYDKSGRSKGTAEVVFMRHSDALAAVKKYNNMRLDGKPLQIELVGTSLVTPAVMPPYQKGLLGRPPNGVFVRWEILTPDLMSSYFYKFHVSGLSCECILSFVTSNNLQLNFARVT